QITLINLKNIPQRLGTSLVVVVGIAGVVGVLVSVLAMGEGFRHTLASTGRPTRVIMLRAGSDAEMSSGVARDQATVLGNLPGIAALRDSVGRDRRLSINVLREPEYYAKQASILSKLIGVLGYSVATFMAIGATFGALNCMYSAIASRQTEIATLRAIGFGGAPVVVSVMIEALVLALVGGAVGGA